MSALQSFGLYDVMTQLNDEPLDGMFVYLSRKTNMCIHTYINRYCTNIITTQ